MYFIVPQIIYTCTVHLGTGENEMPREGWSSVTIPTKTKQLLKDCAKKLDRSQTWIATEAITLYCNQKEAQ